MRNKIDSSSITMDEVFKVENYMVIDIGHYSDSVLLPYNKGIEFLQLFDTAENIHNTLNEVEEGRTELKIGERSAVKITFTTL